MADFVQTMKDWQRMCEHCDRNEKIGCVVNGSVCDGFRKMIDEIDLEVVEAKVTAWAAEHPEPVYPTWIEWLKSMGVVPYMMGLVVTRGADNGHFHDGHVNITAKALEAIPADIAEKLGIAPKEG